MPDSTTLLLFSIAALALVATPGPAVLYIVARSLDQGRMAGIVSTLGIGVGTLLHIAAAALGLSALLVSSALAFTIVKYLGAAYLIYLGIQTLRRPDPPTSEVAVAHTVPTDQRTLWRVFRQGVLVNLLNPKTALFFFAFLPQFVDPTRGAIGTQIVVLGLLLVLIGTMTDSLYALLSGSLGHWLRTHSGFLRVQRYVTGGTYIALGILAAFARTENA